MTFKKAKFKQVLHYIIHKCGHLENVGKTVLYKILYFCDFDYYELNEESLTGETYVKLPRGPAPCHFEATAEELKKDGKIKAITMEYRGYRQKKFLCLKEPQLDLLNAEELHFINREIEKLCSLTATQISGLSHQDMPWKTAKSKEELDYEQVFYRDAALSVREYPKE